jgi:hypothetical protein
MTKLKLTILAKAATLPLAGYRVLLLVWAAGSAGVLGSAQSIAQNAYIPDKNADHG